MKCDTETSPLGFARLGVAFSRRPWAEAFLNAHLRVSTYVSWTDFCSVMDILKTVPTHMDFDGQGRAEKYSRFIITLFGVVGLLWGYIIQQFSQTVYILGAGFVLAALVTFLFQLAFYGIFSKFQYALAISFTLFDHFSHPTAILEGATGFTWSPFLVFFPCMQLLIRNSIVKMADSAIEFYLSVANGILI